LYIQGPKQLASPHDEPFILILEELERLIQLLMDLHRDLHLHLIGKLLHEVDIVAEGLALIVSNRAHQALVEGCLYRVLAADVVQGCHFLLYDGLRGIVRRNDGREGTRAEGEGDHSAQHEENAEDLLGH
jgi:hypothetical protein